MSAAPGLFEGEDPLYGGTWGVSQVVGTSDFFIALLIFQDVVWFFNTIGYLKRFSLQCPGLLSLFWGHVDIQGR